MVSWHFARVSAQNLRRKRRNGIAYAIPRILNATQSDKAEPYFEVRIYQGE